jgi:uncharacterized protein YacL (UPF0231 family)
VCAQYGKGLLHLTANENLVVVTQLALVEFERREITFYDQDSLCCCSLHGEYLLNVEELAGARNTDGRPASRV